MATGLTGYRTFYMTIRIRDEASRGAANVVGALKSVGDEAEAASNKMLAQSRALGAFGTAMFAVAGGGAATLSSLGSSAMEFGRSTAYAFTQVDDQGESTIENIRDIVRRVSNEIPVPLEEVSQGLYDIFSSIDVSVKDSESLITQMGKASVAGQTDVRTAARSTVAVMNAYGMEVKDVGGILDWQFQLVRKGVGTYDDFAHTIGLALPAFQAADQNLDTLGGSLSFLTRSGLTASRAATSSARAMELLAQPRAVENLRKIGIEATNADGTFRQMNDIVTDLATGPFKDLQGPEFREMFKSIFGSGRIQARRFFDIVLKDHSAYNDLVGDFTDKEGAMLQAYDIMYNEPIMRVQELKVQWSLLKETLGEQLLPILGFVVEKLTDLASWFKDLPGWVKTTAAWAGVLITVGAALAGILAFAGMFALVLAAWVAKLGGIAAAGVYIAGLFGAATMGALLIIVAKLILIALLIAAIIAAVILLIVYWEEVYAWLTKIWDKIADLAQAIGRWFGEVFDNLRNKVMGILDFFNDIFDRSSRETIEIGVDWDMASLDPGAHLLIDRDQFVDQRNFLEKFWDGIVNRFWYYINSLKKAFWWFVNDVKKEFWAMIDIFTTGWDWMKIGFFAAMSGIDIAWDATVKFIKERWAELKEAFVFFGKDVARIAVEVAMGAKELFWMVMDPVIAALSTALDAVIGAFWTSIDGITTGFNVSLDWVTGMWDPIKTEFDEIWGTITSTVTSIGSDVAAAIDTAWEILKGTFSSWGAEVGEAVTTAFSTVTNTLKNLGMRMYYALKDGFWKAWDVSTPNWLRTTVAKIIEWADDIWDAGWDIGKSIVDGLWAGLTAAWNWLVDKIDRLWDMIPKPDLSWITNTLDAAIPDAIWDIGSDSGSTPTVSPPAIDFDAISEGLANLGQLLPEVSHSSEGLYMFANGGIVTEPTAGIVGEAGPEAVIPLSRMNEMVGGITVNVYGTPGEDEISFAKRVAQAVGEEVFANGY